ncbi:MAG: beta-glucosidase BglX [Gammaproteobacteria bacterium]|nr:beta-glucosidase BglX [Gammaproteobacteria bacterium]
MASSNAFQLIEGTGGKEFIQTLLGKMTLAEKIGQLCQVNAGDNHIPDNLHNDLKEGLIGSVLNQVDVKLVNELQRIAVEESRLGIPLLIGRDVIHGFKTVLPIPVGQAATWNPDLVRKGAEIAAKEAASTGVNWTFAPMLDISRDPRWGRVAESLGEDPYLASELGEAMVNGFQGENLSDIGSIASCAKHFAGYGAAESGRDYATTNIPENELRNVYLKPFHSAVNAGVTAVMTSFSDVNGIPATANEFLLRQVLRDEWLFDGFVVSDWDSVKQLSTHGLTENDKESAFEALSAGVDMEMASYTFRHHLSSLVAEGRISEELIDQSVLNILGVKYALGLFESPYTDPDSLSSIANPYALGIARQSARESIVMLKNDNKALPLIESKLNSLAVIGPLADSAYEQLGTWIFDGDPDLSITALEAIKNRAGDEIQVNFHSGLETTRSRDTNSFDEVSRIAKDSDAVLLFLGEESILSGEAHCRADINLPGVQAQLVENVRKCGKPVIAVIMAGRPITLTNIIDQVDALLFAWHPGTMGGAAIAELLFGDESPSGKLPISFPRHVGQIPIYYNQKNTGKPPSDKAIVHIDDIDPLAPQTSLGMTAFHLDEGFKPLFPFGFGLSYTVFKYENIQCDRYEMKIGESITVSADLMNTGEFEAEEIAQLYVRDLVGNVTRPVRELKGFRRVHLTPGQKKTVSFEIHSDDLAFYDRNQKLIVEPGEFRVWIGGSSYAELETGFRVIN